MGERAGVQAVGAVDVQAGRTCVPFALLSCVAPDWIQQRLVPEERPTPGEGWEVVLGLAAESGHKLAAS